MHNLDVQSGVVLHFNDLLTHYRALVLQRNVAQSNPLHHASGIIQSISVSRASASCPPKVKLKLLNVSVLV